MGRSYITREIDIMQIFIIFPLQQSDERHNGTSACYQYNIRTIISEFHIKNRKSERKKWKNINVNDMKKGHTHSLRSHVLLSYLFMYYSHNSSENFVCDVHVKHFNEKKKRSKMNVVWQLEISVNWNIFSNWCVILAYKAYKFT